MSSAENCNAKHVDQQKDVATEEKDGYLSSFEFYVQLTIVYTFMYVDLK